MNPENVSAEVRWSLKRTPHKTGAPMRKVAVRFNSIYRVRRQVYGDLKLHRKCSINVFSIFTELASLCRG